MHATFPRNLQIIDSFFSVTLKTIKINYLNFINVHQNKLILLKDSQIYPGAKSIIYLGLSIQDILFSVVDIDYIVIKQIINDEI